MFLQHHLPSFQHLVLPRTAPDCSRTSPEFTGTLPSKDAFAGRKNCCFLLPKLVLTRRKESSYYPVLFSEQSKRQSKQHGKKTHRKPNSLPEVSWTFPDQCDFQTQLGRDYRANSQVSLSRFGPQYTNFLCEQSVQQALRKTAGAALPLPWWDPDGKLPWQHEHTASGQLFLAGPTLTQRISSGFSDLGSITRVTFSHGWITSEQFLWCIRHKHAFCQHQAYLISPPAFSPGSYIYSLLHGKSHCPFFGW